jgi:hypothetical protein
MTAPIAIPPADLLAQLGDLITATQTVSADAEKWRLLVRLLFERGYGPLISPVSIANLVPSATYVAELVAASQEVPPPAAPKSVGTGKRRIITDEDREIIRRAHADGLNIQAISNDYGYAKSTIDRVLHDGESA